MTLRMEAVASQLPGVIAAYRDGLAALDSGLAMAAEAFAGWAASPSASDAAIRAAMAEDPRPYAVSYREPVDAVFDAPTPGPVTVVSADGSSIEPDRFAPVQCFVINTGAVVLPYGVPGEVVLQSTPVVGPTAAPASQGEDSGGDDRTGNWGVNLQRDARELFAGAILAQERTLNGPVVLLLDGTLFPWDLDSRQVRPDVREDARKRTQEALDLVALCGDSVSLGAYISASRSGEVVTSLGALAPIDSGVAWPPTDGLFFRRTLGDGQRSAVFRAQSERGSRVEKLFSPAHQVCFFYLRIGGDIARVELPHWATSAAQVERLHATLVDQCRRAGGYPRALQEAHEQAVISGSDRQQFSRLLENAAGRQGLFALSGGKQMSKRRRAV